MTEDLVRFIELNDMKLVIDRTFAFADARAAYEHLEAGRAFGKSPGAPTRFLRRQPNNGGAHDQWDY
jgi:hypothetical protein